VLKKLAVFIIKRSEVELLKFPSWKNTKYQFKDVMIMIMILPSFIEQLQNH